MSQHRLELAHIGEEIVGGFVLNCITRGCNNCEAGVCDGIDIGRLGV